MERIKFVLVEKSYLIRKGIASIINRIEHATVVKELDSLDTVNSTLQKYQPDFIVVNISLLNELSKFRNLEIHAEMSEIGIGIDSTNEPTSTSPQSLREIISTLDERDDIYKKLEALIQEKLENQNSVQHSELSEREKTILMLVARGMTNKEIAEKLFLSTHTVITHRKNITNKLGIKSISGLTVYAILNDIIRIEELK
jgi:DNA-binding NarL/FixJ family response regulator